MHRLDGMGAHVDYTDPHVPSFPKMRNYRFDLNSVVLTPNALRGYDLVLLATDHDAFDYDMVREHAKLIVDTRGKYLQPLANVVKA
jgi:UDP-N-acetyl-D-glucosamine dehydrogenase